MQQAQAQCEREEPAEHHVQRVAELLNEQEHVQANIDKALEDIR